MIFSTPLLSCMERRSSCNVYVLYTFPNAMFGIRQISATTIYFAQASPSGVLLHLKYSSKTCKDFAPGTGPTCGV